MRRNETKRGEGAKTAGRAVTSLCEGLSVTLWSRRKYDSVLYFSIHLSFRDSNTPRISTSHLEHRYDSLGRADRAEFPHLSGGNLVLLLRGAKILAVHLAFARNETIFFSCTISHAVVQIWGDCKNCVMAQISARPRVLTRALNGK